LQWTFTTYSLPVSTGAPVCLICAQARRRNVMSRQVP
jgi:hypothetical protein